MRSIKFIGSIALTVFIAVFATTAFAQLSCTIDADCVADLCSDGTCVANLCNPLVVCTASDQCHDAGVCDSATGICSNPNAADGTSCSDNNACTLSDTCAGGVCVSGTPKVCTASDQCHVAGTCNTGTGVCSNPAKVCNDNNICTTDTCNVSTGCVFTNNTLPCPDGNACTTNVCGGGVCSSTPLACCSTAASPLPSMTKLLITPGTGSTTNTPCATGSCFGMEVGPGTVVWTDFGPGTDGGIIVGKAQTSGGQELAGSPTNTTPGQLSNAWLFFSNYGTFFTVPGGDTQNIFDSAPCTGACCSGKTDLKVFNVAWNGNNIHMGSAAGCILSSCTTTQKDGVFVNSYTIDPVNGGAWTMNYSQVVPTGQFANVKFTLITRGTVSLPPLACTTCDDGNPCTDDVCDTATGLCVFTNNAAACDDGDACTSGDFCSNGTCQPGATIVPNCGLTAPTLVHPSDGQTGLSTTVEFRWEKSIDPDNTPITYKLYYCTTPDVAGCTPVTVASRSSKGVFYAGGAGLFMIGMTFFGGLRGKRRIVLLFMVLALFAGGTIISCKAKDDTELPANQMNYVATGLSSGTTYYWKVTADNGKTGGLKESAVQSFATQ